MPVPDPPLEKRCSACGQLAEYAGEFPLKTGTLHSGLLSGGLLFRRNEAKWTVSVYRCSGCGHFDLFEPPGGPR